MSITLTNRPEGLEEKLNPRRFSNMSSKMAALVGWILAEEYTNPSIAELVVTSDGYLMARITNDTGFNHLIGKMSDFEHNVNNLLSCTPDLTDKDKAWVNHRLNNIVRY